MGEEMTTENTSVIEQFGDGVIDDATGSLSFAVSAEGNEPAGDTPAAESGAAATPSEPAPATPPATPPASQDTFEKRYNDLRPEFTRVTQQLAEMETKLKLYEEGRLQPRAAAAPAQDEDPFEGIDFAELVTSDDPAKARKVMRDAVERTAKQIVKPVLEKLAPLVTKAEIDSELQQMVGKYPDFISYIPKMQQVLSVEGAQDMSFEAVYHFVKKLEAGSAPSSPQPKKEDGQPAVKPTPAASPAPAAGVTREELERRAARQGSPADTGVAGTAVEPERKVESVKDAFEMAVKEAMLGAA